MKNYKEYFKDFKKGSPKRKRLEVMVFVLHILSNPNNLFGRALGLAKSIEKLKQVKEGLLGSFIKKGRSGKIIDATQTPGYNIARRLNIYLSLLTRLGYPFEIKTTKRNWVDKIDASSGVIVLTVHLPLMKVAIARLIMDGLVIDAAIAAEPNKTGKMSFWGITHKVPVILSGRMSLVKAKSILLNGGCIVMMPDTSPYSTINPNIFWFASRVNARVLFLIAYLNEQSEIEVGLFEPPYSQSSTAQEIEANVRALGEARAAILGNYAKLYRTI